MDCKARAINLLDGKLEFAQPERAEETHFIAGAVCRERIPL